MPLRRRNSVVLAIRGSNKFAGLTFKRPRNHPPYFMRAAQEVSRDLAHAIQLVQRNHTLVRRNLKNAIGRRVYNGAPGAQMLFPQLFDDLRPGCRLIAESLTSDLCLESGPSPQAENRADRSGNGFSSKMPAISQCPVVVSLPGEASVHFP